MDVGCNNICCALSVFRVGFGGPSVNLLSFISGVVLLFFSLFVLFSFGNSNSNKRNKLVLPAYHRFTQIFCLWIFLSVIGSFLPIANSTAVFFIEIFLFAVHIGLLDNWLLFFLMQKNCRPSSVRIANVCSIFTVILYFVLPVSVITVNHDWVHTATNSECVWCSYFIPHSSVIFLYYAYCLLYVIGILGAQSGLMRCLGHKGSIFRPYVMGWALFLFFVYFARAISITFLYTNQPQAAHCISYASTVLYTVGYIPILYYTLKNDSEFCILNKLDNNTDEDETPLLQDDVFTGLPVYDFSDINLIQEIGKGGFGVVYRSAINTEIVAVKRVHQNKQSKDQGYKEFLKEVSILSRVSHPNILGFIGICKNPLCIITEFMSRGSVYEIVHTRKEQLNDNTKRRILLDTAKGMAYLHSINIIHRDLKPHNILVDSKWNSKVADFGLARTKVATTMTRVGTPRWVAPEVIREEKYSDLADVFSFGVICWELETEEVPFANLTPLQILTKLAYEKLALQVPAHTPTEYAEFISKCLSDTPALRPTFNEIITSLERPGL